MSTTVTVSVAVKQITGGALPNARVRFEFTAADIDGAVVIPQPTTATLDADGLGSAVLQSNSAGTQGTQTRVTIYDQYGELQFQGLATIPETDCNLHEVLNLQAPASVDDAQAAALVAQAAAAAAKATSAAPLFTFDAATTDSDPGAGKLRLNHADLASATYAFVDEADKNGNAVAALLDQLGTNALMILREGATSKVAFYRITGPLVDGGSYRKVPIVSIGGAAGGFAADGTLGFAFVQPASISHASSNQQVVFNDGGALAGATGMVWDKTSNTLTVIGGGLQVQGGSQIGMKVLSSATRGHLTFQSTYADAGTAGANRNWSIVHSHTAYGDLLFRISDAEGGDPMSAGKTVMALRNGAVLVNATTNPNNARLYVESYAAPAGQTLFQVVGTPADGSRNYGLLIGNQGLSYNYYDADSHYFRNGLSQDRLAIFGDSLYTYTAVNYFNGGPTYTANLWPDSQNTRALGAASNQCGVFHALESNSYGYYVDAANYSRTRSFWDYNIGAWTLVTEQSGVGGANNLLVGTTGAASFGIITNNAMRWRVNADGRLLPESDATYSIGQSSHRVWSLWMYNDINMLAGGGVVRFDAANLAAPSFTTQSVGTRFVLFPSLGAAGMDYAIGMEGGAMWFSAETVASAFKFYGGTTLAATISGSGDLTLTGGITGARAHVATLVANSDNMRNGVPLAGAFGDDLELGKFVSIGYDHTNDYGVIAAVHDGTTWKGLYLQPVSGQVLIGPGGLSVEGPATAKTLRTTPLTVADLPDAALIAGEGARAFVTDATVAAAGNFGAVVAGGGANKVPVWSDGTNWRIG